VDFEDYGLRNLQAKVLAQALMLLYIAESDQLLEIMELLADDITDGEVTLVDSNLRALIYFIDMIEDEAMIKRFNIYVPVILRAILSAFTNEELGSHGREQVLQIFYGCLRTISWADGIDNELVGECLDETFNQWMSVFLGVIQTDANKFFDIKRNALKCLTVIFRDFINYSREGIAMILRPAWKLMTSHLPIFTEV